MSDCTMERAAPAAPWKRLFRLGLRTRPPRPERPARMAKADLERMSRHIRRDIGLPE